ncbi:hypothetical protein HXX76_000749 [Chlamydomonas incerta]|uniref:DJ-1/PfpI domain-containing protein n=1 Tax=Chlamydomonas incerta TaxID=51695 RepID=A0A836B3E2_CHLIN|nr:hypothetical protein HXX76_000749 [Chlamydomonas incerta]|eukprot:KAG2446154.1 hypothetical protein HXX76_000749 [Chlamydomonas incerta]
MRAIYVAALLMCACFALAHGANKRCNVLSIVTNVGSWVPTTGPAKYIGVPKPTGYWLAEFTHSYTVFKNAGCSITVASPKGGLGPADPPGFNFYANDPVTQALVAKRADGSPYVPVTENTISAAAITNAQLADFDIVFFVGGTGGMWDFPYDDNLHRIARVMWESGKVVSAVCHGPMALVHAKLSDNSSLVAGRSMTGFSNAEEELLGTATVCGLCYPGNEAAACPVGLTPANCSGPHMPSEYPTKGSFLLEDGLKAAGAVYVSTQQDWSTFYFRPHVVRHGRLVTGQNPGAGRETAEAAYDTHRLLRLTKKKSCPVWSQFADTFCSPVQQTAADPPVKCKTNGYIPKC